MVDELCARDCKVASAATSTTPGHARPRAMKKGPARGCAARARASGRRRPTAARVRSDRGPSRRRPMAPAQPSAERQSPRRARAAAGTRQAFVARAVPVAANSANIWIRLVQEGEEEGRVREAAPAAGWPATSTRVGERSGHLGREASFPSFSGARSDRGAPTSRMRGGALAATPPRPVEVLPPEPARPPVRGAFLRHACSSVAQASAPVAAEDGKAHERVQPALVR